MTKTQLNMKIIDYKLVCFILFVLFIANISLAANEVHSHLFQLTACIKQENVPVDVLFIHSTSRLHCAMLCTNSKCSSVMFSNTEGKQKCSLIFDNQQIHLDSVASCQDASGSLRIWRGCPVNRDSRWNNIAAPFVTPIYGGLCDKPTIVISGTPRPNANRIGIKLMCGRSGNEDDVALHIDVCFDVDDSIRQTHLRAKQSGSWIDEQKATQPFPFDLNKSFEMKILSTESGFNIIVNDLRYVTYQTKITDMYRIRYLSVKGGIGKINIKLY